MAELPDGTLVAARMTAAGRDSVVTLGPAAGAAATRARPSRASPSRRCARTGTGWPSSAARRDAPPSVWVWTARRRGSPAPAPRRRVRLRRGRRGPGRALLADRAVGTRRARHALPADAGRDDGPGGTRGPPLVVWCHGGPTSSCQAGLDLTLQFFTTRGFAVACVDYAGSSGLRPGLPQRPLGPLGRRRLARTASMRLCTWRRRGDVDRQTDGRPRRQRRAG